MAKAAATYHGMYISHLRSEGNNLEEAVNEFFKIAKEANIDAQIYHLKAAGKQNWYKMPSILNKIDSLRNAGESISANIYNYTAASTGLTATLPPWIQDGETEDLLNRLQQTEIRRKVIASMKSDTTSWENFLELAGNPDNILLLEFRPDSLSKFVGKTLGEIGQQWNQSPAETIIDLILANGGDISTVYFLMSDDNLHRKLQKPYITFGSDARSVAAEKDVLKSSTHPRTYGNFARLLGKYVREQNLLSLEQAIHRLTLLPAQQLNIKYRGKLAKNYKADIVIFDPETIIDHATFTDPHHYATGVRDVFVNGIQVLKDGEHTGAFPGEIVRGPGYKK